MADAADTKKQIPYTARWALSTSKPFLFIAPTADAITANAAMLIASRRHNAPVFSMVGFDSRKTV
jgi:hypothetical protein